MSELFLDTGYAIALSAPKDQHHVAAVELAKRLQADGAQLVTTRAILVEIGNALSRLQHRLAATRLLRALENDASVEIVPVSEELYLRAFHLYEQRSDKEWGMTDCISFIVMQDRGLTQALTPDVHFEQAGFKALLL
jgi:predicted nucleic acid-binding protein